MEPGFPIQSLSFSAHFKTDLEPIASTPVKHVFIRTRDAMPCFHFGLPSPFEKGTEVLLLVLKVGVWRVSSHRDR
jgi:hypothetical protein